MVEVKNFVEYLIRLLNNSGGVNLHEAIGCVIFFFPLAQAPNARLGKISPFYNDAVQQVRTAILESQLEAARAANKQKMSGLRGFSATNIKYKRIFFERWLPVLNRQPTADELENAENSENSAKIPIFALLNINRPPMAGDLDFSEFLALSFTHHIEILGRCTSLEERAFYIHQTFINHWDKYTLRDYLKADKFLNSPYAHPIPHIFRYRLFFLPPLRLFRVFHGFT